MRWPLVILNGSRYDELLAAERRLARINGITMMVEHVNASPELRSRSILFRASLGEIPDLLTYSGSRTMGPNVMRLFSVDETMLSFPTGDAYDIIFVDR